MDARQVRASQDRASEVSVQMHARQEFEACAASVTSTAQAGTSIQDSRIAFISQVQRFTRFENSFDSLMAQLLEGSDTLFCIPQPQRPA
jgi:hypothetical protein